MIDFEDWVQQQIKEDPNFVDEDGYIAYRPEKWPEHLRERSMSKKRKRKMNDVQITNTPETAPVREVIGTNPDGTPIYKEETVQEEQHTGEHTPL